MALKMDKNHNRIDQNEAICNKKPGGLCTQSPDETNKMNLVNIQKG